MRVVISKSQNKGKKYKAVIYDDSDKKIKTLHFGDSMYESYDQHGDEQRKQAYIARHQKREDWSRSGIQSSGFWSKHILWNEPDLQSSINDTERRFGIKITLQK